jgi:hypothetical protein
MQIDAVVDRTGVIAHDRIVVRCPGLELPQRRLGKSTALAVSVAPGSGSLRLEIDLRDDALSGQFVLEQKDLNMEAVLAEAYGGRQLQDRLNSALDDVAEFRVSVDLAGTLRRPSCRLHSDLGAQLADGLQTAFQQELEQRAEQTLVRVDQRVQQQLDQLQEMVDRRSEALLASLEPPRRELEQMIAPVVERLSVLEQFQLPNTPRMGKLPVRDWLSR